MKFNQQKPHTRPCSRRFNAGLKYCTCNTDKSVMVWIRPKDLRTICRITKTTQEQLAQSFYNDMSDSGWDSLVSPRVHRELANVLCNDALPLLRKLAGMRKLKSEDYR